MSGCSVGFDCSVLYVLGSVENRVWMVTCVIEK